MPPEKTAKPALTEDPATEKDISSEEFSEKESVLTGRVFNLETKIEHTASKDYLEKAIGDMKEGIAEAVGRLETNLAKTEHRIKMWSITGVISLLGGLAVLIGLALTIYKLFFWEKP